MSHLLFRVSTRFAHAFAREPRGAASVSAGRSSVLFAMLCALAGCSALSERQLRADGPTPYVRCVAGPAPHARSDKLATVSLELRDRELHLSHSAPSALRLAVFAAAGMGGPPPASALEQLRGMPADVLLLLGGLGESAEQATASANALAGLGRLVLVVLGGRDGYRNTRSALEALGDGASVVDATPLRSIKIGEDVLIPWGGAEQGRYALDDARCGFGAHDVDEAVQALGPARPGERRWLVGWQALPPVGSERAAVRDAHELGAELVRLAERLGVRGSIAAWGASPVQLAAAGPLTDLLAPRAWGPPLELADGTIVPHAPRLLVFEPGGPRIER